MILLLHALKIDISYVILKIADWYPKIIGRTNDQGNLKSRALDQNKGNRTLSYRYKMTTYEIFYLTHESKSQ